MKYYVSHRIVARHVVEVEADSIEEAKAKADIEFSEADFGVAEDIDGKVTYVEDEHGNRVWEN